MGDKSTILIEFQTSIKSANKLSKGGKNSKNEFPAEPGDFAFYTLKQIGYGGL